MTEDPGYMDNLIDEAQDRAPDVEMEMALLSLCMRKDQAVLDTVENKLSPEDFTDNRNKLIFGVIMDMFLDNAKIDRFTVTNELERRGDIDRAGGQRYVYSVGGKTAVLSNIDEYVNRIREKSDQIKLLNTLDKIRGLAVSGKKKSTEVVDYALSEVSMLRSAGESKGFEVLSEILKSTMLEINSEIHRKDGEGTLKLGFPLLDEMLGGLRPGSLNILAARPGMGKSALAINMASNVAAAGKPVAIFSLEMSKQEIAMRFMSAGMNKPINKIIYSHRIDEADQRDITQSIARLSEFPVYVDDNSGTNPVSMKSKLTQLFANEATAPKLIIVDYLQLMTMPGVGSKSRNEEVTAISRSLKIIAKDFNVPIIALSQMSRGAVQRDDHTPQLSDLRDSGAIEQDADTVMFIDRPDYYKKEEAGAEGDEGGENAAPAPRHDDDNVVKDAFIYLSKNRHGATGKDKVCWIAKKTLFYEYTKNRPEEPGSPYTRTRSSDSAASDYHFDNGGDSVPDYQEQAPSDADIPPEEPAGNGDDLFLNENTGFPDGF